MNRACLLVGIVLAVATTPARAQSWYAGVGGGLVRQDAPKLKYDMGRIVFQQFADAGDLDRRSKSVKVIGGYRVTSAVAVELGYVDYGRQRLDYRGVFGGLHPGSVTILDQFDRRVRGPSLDLVLNLPLASSWSAWGAVGAARVAVETNHRHEFSASFAVPSATEDRLRSSSTTSHFSLGVALAPAPLWTLRLGVEHLGPVGKALTLASPATGRSAVSMLSLTVLRSF